MFYFEWCKPKQDRYVQKSRLMYITKEDILKIKEASSIQSLFEELGSELKKEGNRFKCFSPFQEEKTASCFVDPVRQIFKDFSSDNSGDVIEFVKLKKGLEFNEALQFLADRSGISISNTKEQSVELSDLNKKKEVLKIANVCFVQNLTESKVAWEELGLRGYTRELVKEWELGFAKGDGQLYDIYNEKRLLSEAEELGLIKNGRDVYWNRLIYPIKDKLGKTIGFSGRSLNASKGGKWINPKQSSLYSKTKILYGLNKALPEIKKSGAAIVVEGYNDVISFSLNGVKNVVACCGTVITDVQINELLQCTDDITLCFDGDKAGERAVVKYVKVFLLRGVLVKVVQLPSVDPDEFTRLDKDSIKKLGLSDMLREITSDGFEYLLTTSELDFKGNGISKVKEYIGLIKDIPGQLLRASLLKKLAKKSDFSVKELEGELKSYSSSEKEESKTRYILPPKVNVKLEDVEADIEEYDLFMASNEIWMIQGEKFPYSFKSVSNFSLEVILHMRDDKLAMKLIRVKNIYGNECVFDIPSSDFNSPQSFENAVTNQGNFFWGGTRFQLNKLKRYSLDKMGVGFKIEVLGWHEEGFWVWNNGIQIPNKEFEKIDNNGVWKKGKSCFYIPSANKIYADSPNIYAPQKKAECKSSDLTFELYAQKVLQVHREHGMNGLLFTIATCFSDVVVKAIGNFPLLFLYGPPSTGKDQLIESMQSFFGVPQSPIHIGSNISTSKAQLRKFAQFRNMIVHLSEYRSGDQGRDELLKGLWDRTGYERGTIDSKIGTETVPIESSVILTGNHYPNDDALITRIMAEEMTKSQFTQEDKENYQVLGDMFKAGIGHLTNQILSSRNKWEKRFKAEFREVEKKLKVQYADLGLHDRMVSNIAVLGSAYIIMKDELSLPFTWEEFVEHNRNVLKAQVRKLNTESLLSKWWDCFVVVARSKNDPILNGQDFKIESNLLSFNFTHTYNRIASQWRIQYQEEAPLKSKVKDMLKDDGAWVGEKSSMRMGSKGKNTSAIQVNMECLDVYEEIIDVVNRQADLYPLDYSQILSNKTNNTISN